MMGHIGKNWKTSAVGLVSFLLAAFQTFHEPVGAALKDPAFQSFVVMGVLGLLAKDLDVTGGTSGQPSTEKALEEANQQPHEDNPPAS